jgi:transcriptional regulator with XRE-family HTH domain
MNLSNTINNLRLSLLESQLEFSKRLNVSPSIVSYWERGIRYPSMVNIRKLHKIAQDHNFEFDYIKNQKK